MSSDDTTTSRWRATVAAAAFGAPVLVVLWLALALTVDPPGLPSAIVKIVFAIVAVVTALAGVRWATTAGFLLFFESLAALLYVLLRAETYEPPAAARTVLLLILPLAVAGITLVLAGGVRAGTWPPARFRTGSSCGT